MFRSNQFSDTTDDLKTSDFDSLQDIFDQLNAIGECYARLEAAKMLSHGKQWFLGIVDDWHDEVSKNISSSEIINFMFAEMPPSYRLFLDFLVEDCGCRDFKGNIKAGYFGADGLELARASASIWIGINNRPFIGVSRRFFEMPEHHLDVKDIAWRDMYRIMRPSGIVQREKNALVRIVFEALRRSRSGDNSLYDLVFSCEFCQTTMMDSRFFDNPWSVLDLEGGVLQPAFEAYCAGVPFDDLYFGCDASLYKPAPGIVLW